jgi:cytochrome c oxidase subunit 4
MTLADYRRKRGEPLLAEEHEAHAEHHPSALEYLQIGAILTVVTAIEVALYYIDMDFTLLCILLFVLSIAKFTLVVAWFMHLKFDSRLFTIAFLTGLVTAMSVFAAAIATLHGSLV